MNYGYEDEVVLLAELTPPASATAGTFPIKARAEWLVCKDICIPQKGELDTTLAVSAAEAPIDPPRQASVERPPNQLPVDAPGWKNQAPPRRQTLVVRLT